MSAGLYFHIPFCVRKCTYCDFTSYAGKGDSMSAYADALLSEAALRSPQTAQAVFDSLYFGGGTPTCMPIPLLAKLFAGIQASFSWTQDIECTLECNPGTVQSDDFIGLRRLGFNRLSIGLQAIQPHLLQSMGRIHGAGEWQTAFRHARNAGFENISTDLMFGWPGQKQEHLLASIEVVLSMEPEHISLYGLKVEQGTPLAIRLQRGELTLPDEDEEMDMFQAAVIRLEQTGYHRYEISNFALSGYESRHNLHYWHNDPYLGLGCAAASSWDGIRWTNTQDVDAYMEAMALGNISVSEQNRISPRESAYETLMLALRLREGLNRDAFRLRYGYDPVLQRQEELQRLSDQGMLKWNEERLWLTDRGMEVQNAVLICLMDDEVCLPQDRIIP